MLCNAWIGEWPNLKTVVQSMTHDGTFHDGLDLREIILMVLELNSLLQVRKYPGKSRIVLKCS